MPGDPDDRRMPRSTSAIEAVKLGALDYLTKPLDFERLASCSTRVREASIAGASGCSPPRASSRSQLEFYGMIGREPGDAGALRR